MKIHIAVDPGSTHMGNKKFVTEMVSKARFYGADSIKFQLFPNDEKYTKCGNVYLGEDLFDHAWRVGRKEKIAVTASVFGQKEAEFLSRYPVEYVKFAYSMRNEVSMIKGWLERGTVVVVTTNVIDGAKLPKDKNLIKLFTATSGGQTEYPCTSLINFDGLFPERFQGFSDHTLTELQAFHAVRNGAIWVEKHVTLPYNEVDCPDKHIALDINRLQLYCGSLRKAAADNYVA